MQDVSKEWLDFRRNQFPAGSRIQTWELDDPRNTLEEAGTLEHIDDSGRFHVRQSDGGECVLTLGEEMFSVHPPESTQLKLYMPMTVGFYEPDGWGNWDETERLLDSPCKKRRDRRRGGPGTPGGRYPHCSDRKGRRTAAGGDPYGPVYRPIEAHGGPDL